MQSRLPGRGCELDLEKGGSADAGEEEGRRNCFCSENQCQPALINGDPRPVFVSPPQAQQDWMKLRVPFRKWLEINREK